MKITDEERMLAQFAAERSHRDSQVSNEHSRATAQATILINGGAATAILAFLAKDKIDPFALRNIPYALGIYALGVALGAVMMLAMTHAIDFWNQYWLAVFEESGKITIERARAKAERWWDCANCCFWGTLGCFVVGSVLVAFILARSEPTQNIPSVAAIGSPPVLH